MTYIAGINGQTKRKSRAIVNPALKNQIFIYQNNLISFAETHCKAPSVVGGFVSVERDWTAATSEVASATA
jgi:hypothetical protein